MLINDGGLAVRSYSSNCSLAGYPSAIGHATYYAEIRTYHIVPLKDLRYPCLLYDALFVKMRHCYEKLDTFLDHVPLMLTMFPLKIGGCAMCVWQDALTPYAPALIL